MQTISTPFGARIKTVLPDSSIVWLNSGSSLTFPTVFGKFRKVTLLGEAFFEVTKNSNPFIVSAKGKEVEVKGTSFNVKSFPETKSLETTLVEGTVIVRNTVTMKEVTLRPGQHATLTENEISVKNVETNILTCWKDGKLIFNKEPFPEFVKKLERWYNVKIEYDDQTLNDLWYTGTIEMETISEVMEMLSIAAPVTYSFNNKERVFTIKAKGSK
jgi:ferric-dicitrate binding protein FerR (iron transport regulator)